MKPGRELDKLVAERVMGLDVSNPSSPMSCDVCHKDFYFDGSIKPYSTEIGAAWEVARKFTKLGYGITLTQLKDGQWHCLFDGKDSMNDFEAIGESEAHAICLAALKTNGVEV